MHMNKPPNWKVKIQKEIDTMREEISRGTVKKLEKLEGLKGNITSQINAGLAPVKETLKQRIQVKAQRI